MTELGEVFAELGISHYLNDFIEQGFDSWETILDIQESDFDALNVKLGHRRKIQRKIANSRGLSSDRALGSPGYAASDDRLSEESKAGVGKPDTKDVVGNGPQGAKRKYRRHPKADDNAPERPPSAYVIFSNKMRLDLKGRNLSFTEIAKLVGENWQNLSPAEKEPYEKYATSAKEKFASEMLDYKKTDKYREYTQYVAEFKARQSNPQSGSGTEPSKRPKLDPHPSTTSTGTASSGNDTPSSSRADSSIGQWLGNDQPCSPQPPASSTTTHGMVGPPAQLPSPKILPGYRESIYGANQSSLPWRDGPRDDGALTSQHFVPTDVSSRRFSHSGTSLAEPRNLTGPVKQTQHPPPLLNHESTSSTNSSSYYTPRTPMEPSLERPMALPSIFAQKHPNHYENQLAPLRPPSHSPQTAVSGPLHSPNSIHPVLDIPPTIASLRGYGNPIPAAAAQPETRQHNYLPLNSADEELDPVSALLKAGEIVNRNSRNQHQ